MSRPCFRLLAPVGGPGRGIRRAGARARACSSCTSRRAPTTPPGSRPRPSTTPTCSAPSRPGPASCRSANLGAGVTRSQLRTTPAAAGGPRASPPRAPRVSASQPLYRPANLRPTQQGKRQVDLAQAQLTAAEPGPDHARQPGLLRRAGRAGHAGLRAGAESRRGRAAGLGQAQLRGRHLHHHRHPRSPGALRPGDRAGDRRRERPARQAARAGHAGRQARHQAQPAGGAGRSCPRRSRPTSKPGCSRPKTSAPSIQQAQDGRGNRAAGNRKSQGRPQADGGPDGQLRRHRNPHGSPRQLLRPAATPARVGVVVQPAAVRRLRHAEPHPRNAVARRKGRKPTWKRRAAASRRPPAPPTSAWSRARAR